MSLERNSIEELCVADADAISHFDSLPSLLYLAYVQRGMETCNGISDWKVRENVAAVFEGESREHLLGQTAILIRRSVFSLILLHSLTMAVL